MGHRNQANNVTGRHLYPGTDIYTETPLMPPPVSPPSTSLTILENGKIHGSRIPENTPSALEISFLSIIDMVEDPSRQSSHTTTHNLNSYSHKV